MLIGNKIFLFIVVLFIYFFDHREFVTADVTAVSFFETQCRSFRRRVFPDNRLHWYWQKQ